MSAKSSISNIDSLKKLRTIDKPHGHKLAIRLRIQTDQGLPGLTLIELLSALDILRHSQNLTLDSIIGMCTNPDQLDIFNQAVFQARYYFPKVSARCHKS
ncbi:hypothetical protein A2397_03950 [Candidatus Amesbacteria bacterium RIFOXYB1_FULL_44_23]|uniref:Uncharacterized protein n=1 Tax=Candidatus Amesbacteria bacterium RIFOXYB1_FULL_44_23 TaxID=1797263 RepID=A0A1F4ZVY5_9BACT|nr:MAG: hypothetical protein A2397_03950 [Candidatus Amesbacteria bacterium RIFOXYB1_FULL_44_23]